MPHTPSASTSHPANPGTETDSTPHPTANRDANETNQSTEIVLDYEQGTLALRNVPIGLQPPFETTVDMRDNSLRLWANAYPQVLRWLVRSNLAYRDEARDYIELKLRQKVRHEPFPYQKQALQAWIAARRSGVVVLPTGAGKSYLAVLAMEQVQRSTLVVAPTLDLVSQWYDILTRAFGVSVGVVGGGEQDLQPITVTTYDSAHLQAERFGPKFALVVYDECHHLAAECYLLAARASIAPFRLGLTATFERPDLRHELVEKLLGEVVYRREIPELSGQYLAEYDTITLRVELDDDERERYENARAVYTDFIRSRGISMGGANGWRHFVIESSRSARGRAAFDAYRQQKSLALGAAGKMRVLDGLLHEHRHQRMLIFTQDNATAYGIARQFLLPIITHHTKPKERVAILAGLRSGTYQAVVTSKVLNEGVDVPEADVAVILSGSGSVREHVQRLGRILRRKEGKQAVLYEVISAATAEEWISRRRREHGAYQSR